MLNDFIASDLGAYALAVMFGLGVGLMLALGSRVAWSGTVLVTVAFVAVLATFWSSATGAGALYAVIVGSVSLVATVKRASKSPLLSDEPYWRKLGLALAHPRQVEDAARIAHDASLTNHRG